MSEKEKNAVPVVSPNDLTITGTLLGVQSDNITYISKKTNLQTEAKRDVLVLQCPFGIVLCRAFNPQSDTSRFKVGEQITFAVTEYKIDNGVKSASVRI